MLVAGVCLLVSGCSPGADYPSLFPTVHDTPAARPDATLDPVQVQQATESLITARDHLTAEAQSAGQKDPANSSAAAKPRPAKKQPPAGNGQSASAAGAQTAGAETK